ncbi:MAG: SRPBCC family protein [Bacteroidota bacterium]
MKTLETSIRINAEPYEVWYTFTRFHAWYLWNPFYSEVNGLLRKDERLKVTIFPNTPQLLQEMQENATPEAIAARKAVNFDDKQPIRPLNKSSSFSVRVSQYKENEYFEWRRNHLLLGSYRHRFTFRSVGDGQMEFINQLQMGGFLTALGWYGFIKPIYQTGMDNMNLALKQVVESDDFFVDDTVVEYRG